METGRETAAKWVSVLATLALVGLSLLSEPGSTYRWSWLFLTPLVWMAYAARHRLHLGASHLALLASALLLHNLGAFGFYRREFWTLQFDTYVHFYFGMVGGFLLRAGLRGAYQLLGWRLWVAVIVGILGFGAIHELVEWASTAVLGPERGMLKSEANEPFDTQKDLANNLLGTVAALLITAVAGSFRPRASRGKQPRFDSVGCNRDRSAGS